MNNQSLIKKMENAIREENSEFLISAFDFGQTAENELLFFFKPECFLVPDIKQTTGIIEMVFDKFLEFKVEISGILRLRGKRIEELAIMDRHYGFINKLSRNASKIVSQDERTGMQRALQIDRLDDYKLLGGHEFLDIYKAFDEESLDKTWATKKSLKLRSGFYFQEYEIEKEKILLVNGFHPSQLRWFTHPSHQIIILLVRSNTSWKSLKNDLAGNTFPEKAIENSIRGELYKNKAKYGLANVTIAANCVHLSAGPVEALFEINNFLKDTKVLEFDILKANFSRLMTKNDFSREDIERCLSNPTAVINGASTDLFTSTEEVDTLKAIEYYRGFFTGNAR